VSRPKPASATDPEVTAATKDHEDADDSPSERRELKVDATAQESVTVGIRGSEAEQARVGPG
jgi:hypothetical protein